MYEGNSLSLSQKINQQSSFVRYSFFLTREGKWVGKTPRERFPDFSFMILRKSKKNLTSCCCSSFLPISLFCEERVNWERCVFTTHRLSVVIRPCQRSCWLCVVLRERARWCWRWLFFSPSIIFFSSRKITLLTFLLCIILPYKIF